MDEATIAILQSILDNWIVEQECPHCHELGEYRTLTLTARNGNVHEDTVEIDITHNAECPYTKIARLLGKDGRQFWQDEKRIKRGHIDFRDSN